MTAAVPRRKSRRRPADPFQAPIDAARAAALRHVNDGRTGITRKRSGKGFRYLDGEGRGVRDPATLARIRSLVIPPAWTEVWICPIPNGHVQATGRDARGRKQYRYHPDWHRVRDETKYERMTVFGATLPKLRAAVDAHLDLRGMPRDKLLAVVVRLLETTFIRVGNEEYARTNGSFGLTTLLDHHVDIAGARLTFGFRGKSGKLHEVVVSDRRLARLVQHCRDLPGQDLFQYIDDDGSPQPITSADVNDYVRRVSGEDFTAKDFRTWAGTLLAARRLATARVENGAGAAPTLVESVREVAAQLGNTPAVCRKCYIHPKVLEAFDNPDLQARWVAAQAGRRPRALAPEEAALLRFLATA